MIGDVVLVKVSDVEVLNVLKEEEAENKETALYYYDIAIKMGIDPHNKKKVSSLKSVCRELIDRSAVEWYNSSDGSGNRFYIKK